MNLCFIISPEFDGTFRSVFVQGLGAERKDHANLFPKINVNKRQVSTAPLLSVLIVLPLVHTMRGRFYRLTRLYGFFPQLLIVLFDSMIQPCELADHVEYGYSGDWEQVFSVWLNYYYYYFFFENVLENKNILTAPEFTTQYFQSKKIYSVHANHFNINYIG